MSKLCPPSRSKVSSEWPRIAAVGARRSGPRRASCMHAWSTCSPARRAPARGPPRKSFPRAGKFHHNIWCETKGFTSPPILQNVEGYIEQRFTINMGVRIPQAWLEWFDLVTNRYFSKTKQHRQIGEPSIKRTTNRHYNWCQRLMLNVYSF